MEDLIRKIEKKDIPKINELLIKVFGDSYYSEIERLGGMMNHTYRIKRKDNIEYVVRIPGEGTEELINRKDEVLSTTLASNLKIDSELLYMDEEGRKVTRFIHCKEKMTSEVMRRKNVIKKAASAFNKLHNCGENTGVIFDIPEQVRLYEKVINQYQVTYYDNYEEVRKRVKEIFFSTKNKYDKIVFCHNDNLAGNWILDENDNLYLIDWEFAGMNDAIWDLSCLSIENDYSEEEDQELLKAYFNRKVTKEDERHFMAEKILIDYLWTLWGLARIPYDGEYMQEYANQRYSRLQENIKLYEKLG